MSADSNWKSFLGGVVVGGFITLFLKGKESHFDHLPARNTWQRILEREIGNVQAAFMIGKVQARYHRLLRDRPYFSHPVLRRHLEKSILPGLALYQVLMEETGDEALAKARTGLLMDEQIRQSYASIKSLSSLPFFFSIFRRAIKPRMAIDFPPSGWEIEWVRDDQEAFAFNIKQCFYLKVLTEYGAPELTPIFCHTDEAGMEGIASIAFERTTTLGRGGVACDFCYRKVF